jgi:1-acyl-sn-glycerol-3-phosphate acyltransferase
MNVADATPHAHPSAEDSMDTLAPPREQASVSGASPTTTDASSKRAVESAGAGLLTPTPIPASPAPVVWPLAVWRLLRVVLHMLHGMWVVVWHLRDGHEERRHAAIRWWSAKVLRVLGVSLVSNGSARPGGSLLVANHVSWLDIASVHAVCPQARFVAKNEVKSWPLMGWLAAHTGTVFIERGSKRDAMRVAHQMAELLQQGQTVALFPEGTTSRNEALLPFHANLFQAAIVASVPVQAACIRYAQPGLRNSPAPEFVGEMSLIRSLWQVARARELSARVSFLISEGSRHADRRALAEHMRQEIQAYLSAERLESAPEPATGEPMTA